MHACPLVFQKLCRKKFHRKINITSFNARSNASITRTVSTESYNFPFLIRFNTIRSIIDSNAVEFNSQLDDVLNNSNDMIEFSGFVVYLSNTDGKSFLNLIFFFLTLKR